MRLSILFILVLFITLTVPNKGLAQITELPWSEDFSGVNEFELPEGWESNQENWYVFNSSFAEGESPELVFWWEPIIDTLARVQSPAFQTTDYETLEVTFRHYVGNFEDPGIYDLRMVTIADGERYVVIEWVDPDDVPAEEVVVQLNRDDHGVGADELHLAWEFEGSSGNITRWAIDDVRVEGELIGTSSDMIGDVPDRFGLDQNYPNPFNPTTQIQYRVPNSAHVTLTVYNMLGQSVQTIVDQMHNAGHFDVTFDGSNLSSGVYIYRLQAGDYSATKKFMLVK